MAAKTIKQISVCLSKKAKIARCMPNLCAEVQKSSSLICFNRNIKQQDEQFVEKFTMSFGYFHKIKENLFDEMTIISGCVPAFFALFCNSLLMSMSSKVNKEIATNILKESLFGTGEVLLATGSTFSNFIQSVCSKGGVTEAGIEVFRDKFNKASKKARKAMLKRSKSLATT
jgi:pyrroline-5-carboxylate reductase